MIQTRDIDASIKVEQPKRSVKAETVTTTTMSDLADIAEKKRRDKIMVEKKEWEEKIKKEGIIKAQKDKMAKVRAAKKEKKK